VRLSFKPRTIRGKLLIASLVAIGSQVFFGFLEPRGSRARGYFLWEDRSLEWCAAHLLAPILGLALLVAVGTHVAKPIRRICRAAHALSAGDFRKRVVVTTGDEFELLGNAFNGLGQNLLKREAEVRNQAELLSGMVEAARQAFSTLDVRQCGKTIAMSMCEQLRAGSAVVFRKNGSDGGIKAIGRSGGGQIATWKRLATHATDSGEYLVVSERRPSDQSGESFLVGIPLRTGSRCLGAIVARFDCGDTRGDLRMGSPKADVLISFGIHAASALANAETYSQTEEYSEILEDWVDHLSSVMQVTSAISPSLTLDGTMSALAIATASVLKAHECAIYLLDRSGNLAVRSCCHKQNRVLSELKIQPDCQLTGVACAEKRPIACFDISAADSAVARAVAEELDYRGALSAPLLIGGEAIGAITVYDKQPRHFSADEMRLLTSIALHAAVVVRNADLYTRESSIAETLQKGLVSETPTSCKGLSFASEYMAALDEARVGGDFYEVNELPDGRIGVVMGDVSGKGLQAAIHLATCKNMIKALMYTHPGDPARVLRELNDALNFYFDLSFFVTVFCGVIDTQAGTLTYASAGHPPAVLICEGGRVHTCLPSTGTPAGSGQSCQYWAQCIDVEPSDLLLLYTDGVTDIVKDGALLGLEGLHEIIFQAGPCSPKKLVGHIRDRIREHLGSSSRDDIALMAMSFEGIRTKNRIGGGSNELATQIARH